MGAEHPRATIWLDVSVLTLCGLRQPNGIGRAVAGIYDGLRQLGYSNIRFCHADIRMGGYVEVSPAHIWNSATALLPATCEVLPDPEPDGKVSRAKRWVRGRVPGFAWQSVRAVGWLGRACARLVGIGYLYRAAQRRASRAADTVGPHDVLLNFAPSWAILGSLAQLARLRAKHGFRTVHLVYDLIPVLQPQWFTADIEALFREYLAAVLPMTDLMLTISHHTRTDLRQYGQARGLEVPPVEVIRLAENEPRTPADTTRAGPFVLCVGTVEVRKNHHLLYHLWRRLAQRHPEGVPTLVFAGSEGWLTDDLLTQIRNDPLTRDTIEVRPGVSEGDLAALYRDCLFTLYPSHYEGWGLPVAESLALGKVCISSNAASLGEIAPGLCPQLDPCDLFGWLDAVERLLFEPGHRDALEGRIRRDFRRTTCRDTAAQIVSLVERHFGPVFARPTAELARSA